MGVRVKESAGQRGRSRPSALALSSICFKVFEELMPSGRSTAVIRPLRFLSRCTKFENLILSFFSGLLVGNVRQNCSEC